MDPLTPLAISAASQSIKPLARGVSQLTDFASVLAGEMAEGLGANVDKSVPAATDRIEALQREASEIIDRLLGSADLAANPPLRINVQSDGELTLADDHPRAAEIESLLNGDASLRRVTGALSSQEKTEIQLVWPATNLTKTGLPSYIMGNERPFGG